MSEKTRKQDRRTRYTRQTIKDTFLELLNQKSYYQILYLIFDYPHKHYTFKHFEV